MNKKEFLNEIYKEHSGELPAKYIVENTFNAMCAVMAAELLGGGEISLPGVGKLKVKKTVAREGRNPRTGAVLTIPARRKAVFTESKNLRENLNAQN